MGVLAVARAIGDAPLKPFVSSIPDTKLMPRDEEQWYVCVFCFVCVLHVFARAARIHLMHMFVVI
jgi:hypothetical protein